MPPPEVVPTAVEVVSPSSIEHLDQAWEIPCERITVTRATGDVPPACGGTGVAEWALHKSCGCGIRLYCTGCKDQQLSWHGTVECADCHEMFTPPSTAYSFIESLRS